MSWHGTLVLERYYHGAQQTRLANIKSVSKSLISTLVGIAVDSGAIKSVTQPIRDFRRHRRRPPTTSAAIIGIRSTTSSNI
ncbi:MAG: hypothetical protein LC791_08845 [Acidobacteria bacterium]|nr:hypothetical protein [Acidobacteriota bacterium]